MIISNDHGDFMSASEKQIPAGLFKAKCLAIMGEVQQQRQSVIITKRGVPVAKLVPIEKEGFSEPFGCLAGSVKINGDIISSINEDWDVDE